MKLVSFSIEGYRRFVAKTSVKLHGDLIAFVGPNEAGKSSLLQALTHLNDDRPFLPSELPRRSTAKPRLEWHLQLEQKDKALLSKIPGVKNVERIVIAKDSTGRRLWGFEPGWPQRNKSQRNELRRALARIEQEPAYVIADRDEQASFTFSAYERVMNLLSKNDDSYRPEDLKLIAGFTNAVTDVNFTISTTDAKAATGPQQKTFRSNQSRIVSLLRKLLEVESEPSPARSAVKTLRDHIPPIIYFSEDDRVLASEYSLIEVASDPPKALKHIADLAGLDLVALVKEIEDGRMADVGTRRNAANKTLLSAFDGAWNQQGIAVQFEVHRDTLHIHATTPEDGGLSEIDERSDGMRWFTALLAFTQTWKTSPILLVDEIETHLHYDAQADVMAVLSKQEYTSKVIYTTHSFGCLPNDLGTGVRAVSPIDSSTSKLENGFWRNGAGFSPLLASMGATAVAFTPTRYALIAEGPSDAIVLPTLFRHAIDASKLSFHVAPGVSNVSSIHVPGLDAEAGRVAFIVDGDEGGLRHREKLINNGIASDRIIVLQDASAALPYETEDLIDPEIYVTAVMDELRCWQTVQSTMTPEDLPGNLRTKAVTAWCVDAGLSSPDKVAVAQRVVDMGAETSVVDPIRRQLVTDTYEAIRSVLHLT
ncbi:AAA family ATPase [Kribbella sp. NPDC049174]|uniref:AAA family ATPase n=1 Tax=Kribbella sp. NPDC049174 TaxID=3364112 RepID=UPI00371FA476